MQAQRFPHFGLLHTKFKGTQQINLDLYESIKHPKSNQRKYPFQSQLMILDTHRHTHRHKHTQTQTHTYTDTDTDTDTDTYIYI